tara:strand:+ start:273 stop:401 length:129 start_codon:yes stop_codon:yes gene_type:complete
MINHLDFLEEDLLVEYFLDQLVAVYLNLLNHPHLNHLNTLQK